MKEMMRATQDRTTTMATVIPSDRLPQSGSECEPFLAHIWHRASDALHVWHERAVARHELAELDDYILRDIGMTRGDVMREADKPFWQP
jgi:uncharacterized protein YjiS (DUF1127 family)